MKNFTSDWLSAYCKTCLQAQLLLINYHPTARLIHEFNCWLSAYCKTRLQALLLNIEWQPDAKLVYKPYCWILNVSLLQNSSTSLTAEYSMTACWKTRLQALLLNIEWQPAAKRIERFATDEISYYRMN